MLYSNEENETEYIFENSINSILFFSFKDKKKHESLNLG